MESNTPHIQWTCKAFENLSPTELYQIIQLRNEVFVVEQQCIFQDADGKDLQAWHLMGKNQDDKLIAYTRLLNKGVAYTDYASIGRVVTEPTMRKFGIGKQLMEESIKQLYQLFGKQPIKIGAQAYLYKFYTELGFQDLGKPYMEDGIPHLEMLRS